MDQIVNQQRKLEANKAQKMLKLLEDPNFQEVIMDDFMTAGAVDQALKQNLDNSKTIDELKARQILHNHIFGIITTGEKLNLN